MLSWLCVRPSHQVLTLDKARPVATNIARFPELLRRVSDGQVSIVISLLRHGFSMCN